MATTPMAAMVARLVQGGGAGVALAAGALAVGGAGIGGLTVWSGWVGFVAALVVCGSGMGMVWAFTVAPLAIGPGEGEVEAWEVMVSLLVGVAGVTVAATAWAFEELFGRGRSLAGSIELGLRAWAVVSVAGALLVAVGGPRAGVPAPLARSTEVGDVR